MAQLSVTYFIDFFAVLNGACFDVNVSVMGCHRGSEKLSVCIDKEYE